ncbi:hypothetical protein ACHAQA_003970 [Verticillium albo-atrum]
MLVHVPFLSVFLYAFTLSAFALKYDYGPYDYGFNVGPLIKRQNQQTIVVTNLPSLNGSIPIRPEIRQMKLDPFKWNLYLLALSMMQHTGQDQQLSWYQITGKYFPLPIISPRSSSDPIQVLYHLVQMIASWFRDPIEQAAYEAAASDFRIPYWDWAVTPDPGESAFLSEFRRPALSVYGPNGEQLIANPLFSYQFRPLDPEVFDWGDFPDWTETKRSPTGNSSNNTQSAQAVDRVLPNLQERLFNLFSNYRDYGPFSNKRWGDWTDTSQYDSLESLHDEIHIEVGHGGHLFYIQYSAFDPLFFLHHAMVDRIFAMWQILYPRSWVTEQNTTVPTYTMARGLMQNSSSSLTPFLANMNGQFWNSDMARYTQEFGYAYAETTGLGTGGVPGADPDDRARVSSDINRLYGSSSPSMLARKRKRATRRKFLESSLDWLPWGRKGTLVSEGEVPDLSPNAKVAELAVSHMVVGEDKYTEWLANVRVINGALNGSFSILFFLGPAPQEVTSWKLARNLVGSMGVFAMPHMASDSHVSGTVPLTKALVCAISQGFLNRLDRDEVIPYLQKNLQLRITGRNGEEVDAQHVRGLCVGVASSEVRVARVKWELPNWGQVTERFTMFC